MCLLDSVVAGTINKLKPFSGEFPYFSNAHNHHYTTVHCREPSIFFSNQSFTHPNITLTLWRRPPKVWSRRKVFIPLLEHVDKCRGSFYRRVASSASIRHARSLHLSQEGWTGMGSGETESSRRGKVKRRYGRVCGPGPMHDPNGFPRLSQQHEEATGEEEEELQWHDNEDKCGKRFSQG